MYRIKSTHYLTFLHEQSPLYTPLQVAYKFPPSLDIMKELLAHGADIHAPNHLGQTIADMARRDNRADILALLDGWEQKK